MKSKLVKAITLLISAVMLLPYAVACGGECKHENTTTRTVVAATCTEGGVQEIVCSDCGNIVQSKYVSKIEHAESSWQIDYVATCQDSGLMHKECLVCQTVLESQTLPKTTHTPGSWQIMNGENGNVRVQRCSVCNDILNVDRTEHTSSHVLSDWIMDVYPTCTSQGLKHKECTECGELVDYQSVAVAAHAPSSWKVQVPATCLATGVKFKDCVNCGTVLETATIAKKSHSYVGGSCTVCGAPTPGGGGGGASHDPYKTVNVLICKGGYGDGYLRDVADAFNELYEEENGWYVNIMTPREGFGTASALSEMRLGASTGYDLVFPGSVFLHDVLDPIYGVCVEEITDVWNSTSINFDGSESEKTILESFKGQDDLNSFSVVEGGQRKFYGFPLTTTVRGIATNRTLFEEITDLDFDTDYPKTTDEFIEIINMVMEARDDGLTNAFPMAYGGSNAATYSNHTYLTAERQILGATEHYEDKTWNNYYTENGNSIPQDDYNKVLDAYYRYPVIEWTLNTWDALLANPGSDSITHDVAHGQIMLGDAMFMFDGEYFYNEVQYDYTNYLEDLSIFHDPIHSFVGLKYNLCGKTPAHDVLSREGSRDAHCADCDAVLSAFCSAFDPIAMEVGGLNLNATHKAAIKAAVADATGVTLTSEQYDALVDARGFVYGGYNPMYMIKDCGVEEIAKLFLRMLASQDAADVRTEYGMLHPYYDNEIDADAPEFIKQCMRLEKLSISRGAWSDFGYHGYHGSPRSLSETSAYGQYGATMGVTSHDIMSEVSSWEERNYAREADLFFGSDLCDRYIRTQWNSQVARVPNNIQIVLQNG